MRRRRTMSRWALARRLHETALRIAAGKPVRIGGALVRVPDRLTLEEELETREGETELEFELTWPAMTRRPAKTSERPSRRRGRSR